jgi:hypothetical protein
VLALLKSCEASKDVRDMLDDLENELNADMDLFNFNFSINFDLAIFRNILDCLRLYSLANMMSAKENLCAIAQDIANRTIENLGKIYDKMKSAFSFDETPAP